MAKEEKKKKPTQVALAPAVVPLLKKVGLYGTAFGAGKAAEKLYKKYFPDDEDDKDDKKDNGDKKPKKTPPKAPAGKVVARKGGLIRSKPRDGIAKKGKTKGRIIRGVLNK